MAICSFCSGLGLLTARHVLQTALHREQQGHDGHTPHSGSGHHPVCHARQRLADGEARLLSHGSGQPFHQPPLSHAWSRLVNYTKITL